MPQHGEEPTAEDMVAAIKELDAAEVSDKDRLMWVDADVWEAFTNAKAR